MTIDNMVDSFIALVKGNSYFDDIKVRRAYPFQVKPTLANNSFVAVYPSDIDVQCGSVGESTYCGEICIAVDIYVPYKFGTECIPKIFSQLIQSVSDWAVTGIQSSAITADSQTLCYIMQCKIIFNDKIEFGGGDIATND